jgi:hypothetical protein
MAYEKETTRCKENHSEPEIILGALNALQDKNTHLENSLSAETRIKLDLFSALGEAKRQLEIKESKYALNLKIIQFFIYFNRYQQAIIFLYVHE